MGLDITISRVEEIKCHDCEKVVTKQTIDYIDSCGRVWRKFLDLIGYNNKWNCEDMVLSEDQLNALVKFANDNDFWCKEHIKSLVATGLFCGEKIVINANW